MKDQFVTYEIALKLKELKFNMPCIAGYDEWVEEDEERELKSIVNEMGIISGVELNHLAYTISAPLWQQVIDWLRDEKSLVIQLDYQNNKSSYHIHKSEINYSEIEINHWNSEIYNSYNEAKEQAILKALTLIKK